MGLSKPEIDRLAGMETDGIIGLDILQKCRGIIFDKNLNRISFGKCLPADESVETVPLNIKRIMGHTFVTMPLKINNHESNAVLDTGARIDYASDDLLVGCEYIGDVEDYSPSFGGRINTRQYNGQLEIANISVKLPIVEMTTLLKCHSRCCNAIIGLNGFESKIIGLDFVGSKMILGSSTLDYPLMQGILFVTTAVMTASIIITDLICILTDPRVRLGEEL